MKPAVKFLFDTSFDVETPPKAAKPRAGAPAQDASKPEAPAPAPAPPPTFSAAELSAARQEAHAQGLAEGEATALAAAAQTNGTILAAILESLPGIFQQTESGLVTASRYMLETTLAGLRRLMPALNRRGGFAEIEGLLQETISHLRSESRIVVRLHDSLLDGLRAEIDPMTQAAGFEGKLVLLADDEIAPGDCRIEWADGGVERVADRIWTGVEAAVTRAIAASSATGPSAATHTDPAGAPAPQRNSATAAPSAGKPQET